MLSSHRLWPARLSSNVDVRGPVPAPRPSGRLSPSKIDPVDLVILNSSGRFQRIADDPLRLFDDGREVALAAEALGVNLVQALGSRRTGREPAARGDDLEAPDGGPIARRPRQLARDRLAGECGGAHGLR